MGVICHIDREFVRQQVRRAQPFPFFAIDGFLDDDFVREVMAGFPAYEAAAAVGKRYYAVNEKKKVQVSDVALFPAAVAQLHAALAEAEFCDLLAYVFDIPHLLPDPLMAGGGMHLSAAGGHLDVHVDFNYIAERGLHRRLNILLYFNEGWQDGWGGAVELWNKDVTQCEQRFTPVLNRCVVFETSDISFHGVTSLHCPKGVIRKSFAAYYYTKEAPAPAHWTGEAHSTLFRARPDEKLKGQVLMPLEKAARHMRRLFGL